MNLDDALEATEPHEPPRAARPQHPKGYEPGYEWDGRVGYVNTGPLEQRPKTWDAFIRDAGIDPEEVDVIEPVQLRGWDMPQRLEDGSTGLVRAHYYRLSVRRRTLRVELDELVKAAKRRTKTPPPPPDDTDEAFVVALGDLQLGKVDGDGVEGTVARFLTKNHAAAERYRRLKLDVPVYLFHLGDCIEGMVSQGGANTWRTTLSTTEQVRLYRRLTLEQIKAWAPIAGRIVLAGVPGNHDEAHRPIHTYGDSWAIETLAAVRDSLELAGRYDHVSIVAPARDELTLTLDVAGTIVGLAHGHQFSRGPAGWETWWKGQQMGRQPIGDADVLIAGHLHHLRIEQPSRTFWQLPALESESTWFRHRAGTVSPSGILTALVGGGGWRALEIM